MRLSLRQRVVGAGPTGSPGERLSRWGTGPRSTGVSLRSNPGHPFVALLLLVCMASPLFAEDALFIGEPQLLAEKGAGEGPAWHAELGLLTSGGDGHIWRRDRDGKASIYRENAGTNGLRFDRKGRLVMCEPVSRSVSRLSLTGECEVLTDNYQGKRYNQPNDLTFDSKDRIYFTDPRYGDRSNMEIRDADGNTIEGVYRIDPDGKVTRILSRDSVDRPNGIVITPDDTTLYIADNNNDIPGGARKLWRFTLTPEGTVEQDSRKLIHDWKQTRGPDGMKLDVEGRLYVAAGLNRQNPPHETQDQPTAGIYVFSPDGKLLKFVNIPRDETTNCAFGGDDKKSLFITAGGTLWSVKTTTAGQ